MIIESIKKFTTKYSVVILFVIVLVSPIVLLVVWKLFIHINRTVLHFNDGDLAAVYITLLSAMIPAFVSVIAHSAIKLHKEERNIRKIEIEHQKNIDIKEKQKLFIKEFFNILHNKSYLLEKNSISSNLSTLDYLHYLTSIEHCNYNVDFSNRENKDLLLQAIKQIDFLESINKSVINKILHSLLELESVGKQIYLTNDNNKILKEIITSIKNKEKIHAINISAYEYVVCISFLLHKIITFKHIISKANNKNFFNLMLLKDFLKEEYNLKNISNLEEQQFISALKQNKTLKADINFKDLFNTTIENISEIKLHMFVIFSSIDKLKMILEDTHAKTIL